ncbi:hypothetical protein QTP88_029506 [Uroleucon formosanum]
MNCSKCSCKLSERDKIIKCVNCANSYHVACSSLAIVNYEIFIKKSESWAYYVCEAVKLGVKKPQESTSLDPDLLSKINNIYLAVREIKKSVSKHDSLLSELNKKLDEVSNQLRDLGTRTTALENRMDSVLLYYL